MTSSLDELMARRLLIVTGKGGTGKTTLCAALGQLAAARGLRTLMVELGDRALCPALLGHPARAPAEADGRTPRQLGSHLHSHLLVPLQALAEYLEIAFRLPTRVDRLLANPGFSRLLDAAPGWRELITLGKLWHLTTRMDGSRPRFDLLVVDAPATGHGLSLLSVPTVVFDTVRLGPLRRNTELVHELLVDPERTRVIPVSLPEELPVKETLELVARVRELGMRAGPVVINGVESAPRLAQPRAQIDALRAYAGPPAAEPCADPHRLAEVVEFSLARAALQREFSDRLEREVALPTVSLPFLPGGARGEAAIAGLGRALADGLAAVTG